MKRAAIYARFSSDLQSDRSIEDQFAICRERAKRDGFKVVAIFDDRARSGASVFGRPGLASMMDSAKAGAFDVLIVEALAPRGDGVMSVRTVPSGGTLLFEIALAIFGIVGIGLALELIIILVCR